MERARALGATLRVAHLISGGMADVVVRTKVEARGRTLTLVLPPDLAPLDGARVTRRLEFARLAGLDRLESMHRPSIPDESVTGSFGQRRRPSASPPSIVTTWLSRTARAISPCFSFSAASPNSSRRQPGERRHVGAVVAGDRLEVIDGRDDLGGDAVALAGHLEEHLEQVDGGAVAVGGTAGGAGCAAARPSECPARRATAARISSRRPRALETARDRAQLAERRRGRRLLRRDLVDGVVLQHAAARHVAGSAPPARATRRPRRRTASSIGLRTRSFSRFHASSGSRW